MEDYQTAFRKTLEANGLIPGEIIPDGEIRRCGDIEKPRGSCGWYVLFADPFAGAFGNWRSGLKEKWSSNGRKMTPEQQEILNRKIERERKAREKEEAQKHAEAAREAQGYLALLENATDNNPYLKRKGVKAVPGLKADGDLLLVPVFGEHQQVMSYQRVPEKGKKKFLTGGKTKGGYFLIEGVDDRTICIAEGIATGLSIHEENACKVYCAFSAGNLEPVAKMVREEYPEHEIIICADDDSETEKRTGENRGLKEATKAAKAVNGKVATPGQPGDFNDLHHLKEGLEAVRRRLEAAEASPRLSESTDREQASNFISAETLLATEYKESTPVIGSGIMPDGSHIIISGEAGVGKSLLRSELALHLVMGWDWLGFPVPEPRRVAIFQFENTESMEAKRLKTMREGMSISELPEGSLSFIERGNRLDLTKRKDRNRLEELVLESGAEVIIYDCLANLHSSDENDNMAMRTVLDTLSEVNAKLGTSCILIHHFGKPTEGRENRYRTRGAQSIVDWAVTAAGFFAKPHENRTLRILEFFKVRDGVRPNPITLERDESFLLTPADEDTLCPPRRVKEILESLGGQVDKQMELKKAIMEETGCSPRSAVDYIHKAVEQGVIQEKANGNGRAKSYRLPIVAQPQPVQSRGAA